MEISILLSVFILPKIGNYLVSINFYEFQQLKKKRRLKYLEWDAPLPEFQSEFSYIGGVIACCGSYTNIQAIAPPIKSPNKTNALISPIGAIIARNAINVPTPRIKNLPDHISNVGTCSTAKSFVVRKLAVLSIANEDNNVKAIKPITPVNTIFINTLIPDYHLPSLMN